MYIFSFAGITKSVLFLELALKVIPLRDMEIDLVLRTID